MENDWLRFCHGVITQICKKMGLALPHADNIKLMPQREIVYMDPSKVTPGSIVLLAPNQEISMLQNWAVPEPPFLTEEDCRNIDGFISHFQGVKDGK